MLDPDDLDVPRVVTVEVLSPAKRERADRPEAELKRMRGRDA